MVVEKWEEHAKEWSSCDIASAHGSRTKLGPFLGMISSFTGHILMLLPGGRRQGFVESCGVIYWERHTHIDAPSCHDHQQNSNMQLALIALFQQNEWIHSSKTSLNQKVSEQAWIFYVPQKENYIGICSMQRWTEGWKWLWIMICLEIQA